MAPTVALCRSSSMPMQSCEAMGYAKRRLASGIWICQPSTLPSGSSGTTKKKDASLYSEPVALDLCLPKQEEAALALPICETPRSKKHKIPVVDVDLCPPAPKKVRLDHCRLPVACSGERERSNFHQKLSFSPGYLF